MKDPTDKSSLERIYEHIYEQAVKEVLEGMSTRAKREREKTEPYQRMFKEGSTYTGLLREIERQSKKACLDACSVLEKQGVKITKDVLGFFLAVPFVAYKLQKEITDAEGLSCCVDKVFYLLSERLKELIK